MAAGTSEGQLGGQFVRQADLQVTEKTEKNGSLGLACRSLTFLLMNLGDPGCQLLPVGNR